jgi:type I restriction enzyme S subunit
MNANRTSDGRLTPLNVGNIPDDWDVSKIAHVASRVTNGYVGPVLEHQTMVAEDKVRYLQGFNVRANRIELTNESYVSAAFDRAHPKSRLEENDILTVQSGHIGTTARVPKELAGSNCHALIITRPRPELIDSTYLTAYLNSHIGQARMRGLHVGSSIVHINTSELAEFRVPLPPLPEQRKIADILSLWDEALTTLDALIEAHERRKKALMQQVLTGRIRLKGFSKPWKRFRFSELLEPQDRYVEFDDDHTYSLVSIRRRSGGVFFREALQGSDIKTKVMKRVQSGDFVISRMQVVHGALGMVRSACDGMYASDSYDVLIEKNDRILHMPFLDWMSRMRSFWHLAYISSHGVHIEKMTFKLSDFMHEKITLPADLEEQRKIAHILDTADQQLTLLRTQRTTLDQQKRGLMQRLLTGKIRVKPQTREIAI